MGKSMEKINDHEMNVCPICKSNATVYRISNGFVCYATFAELTQVRIPHFIETDGHFNVYIDGFSICQTVTGVTVNHNNKIIRQFPSLSIDELIKLIQRLERTKVIE